MSEQQTHGEQIAATLRELGHIKDAATSEKIVACLIDQGIKALEDASRHMEACRALLKVPDDEVLYQQIKETLERVAALEKDKERLDWLNKRNTDGWSWDGIEYDDIRRYVDAALAPTKEVT